MPAADRPPHPTLLDLPAARRQWGALSKLWAVLGAALSVWPSASAWGAEPASAPLPLGMSTQLVERLTPDVRRQIPTFVSGERIHGRTEVNTVVDGQAELRRHDTVVRADRLEHLVDSDTAIATGQVRINRMGNVFEGPSLRLKLDTFEGRFEQPRFRFLRQDGQGDASWVDFVNEDVAVAHDVRYSTCERPPLGDWAPDWLITASRIEFDNAEETGTATNGVLRFKNVPILATPWLSFPLTEKRKSGVLPPTVNLDDQSGLELTLPYYLNLAPNRDATLYPTVMSKRGIDLGAEFRYLDPRFEGSTRVAFMPNDRLRQADRWSASLGHQQQLDALGGLDQMGLRLRLNRVSDDDYWRDFPHSGAVLTQRLLPSETVWTGRNGAWGLSAGAYGWQTLQDPAAPIVAPYDRVHLGGVRGLQGVRLAGVDWSGLIQTDITRFDSPQVDLQPQGRNGTRALALARLEHLWQTPGAYLRPSLQLHARHYAFDQPLSTGATSASYLLPTASVDGGLFLERQTDWFGTPLLQTLEPRAFLTATPWRDQNALPVYDTAAYDFNLATIFSPNPYAGHDRMADLRALTLGLTTRLIDPDTGVELASVGLAQRRRLSDQRVNLNEPGATQAASDVLLGATLNWSPQLTFNGTLQYNSDLQRSVRTTLSTRYQPGPYRVLNAAYRLQRQVDPESEQLNLSWQWPLSDLASAGAPAAIPGRALGPRQWYSVGRVNYSMTDNRIVDLVAGFEYDAGCWIGRVVMERLQQSYTSANKRILLQLEFSGFSRLGSNPLQTLRQNVPRYQFLREEINPPSRFVRYD